MLRSLCLAGAEGLEPDQPSVLETAALPIELHPYIKFTGRTGRSRTADPTLIRRVL